jgi:hypothetical protein
MKSIAPYIEKAKADLARLSLREIQVETALVWAGRACAAATMGSPSDAREYAHEAIEHAALSGDEELLAYVRSAFTMFRVIV